MIFESDTISIKSKRQASEHIIERYGDFGWSLSERKEDKLYSDIVHLTFTRPHCIKNKDKLQLMQVRLEIAYNTMGRLSCKIPVRSSLFVGLSGLLSAGLVACGVIAFLFLEGLFAVISGAVLCALGLTAGILCMLFTNRIYKKDKEKYSLLIEKQVDKIDGLCRKARILRGEDE